MDVAVSLQGNGSSGLADFERLMNEAVKIYMNLAYEDKSRAQFVWQKTYMHLCMLHEEPTHTGQPAGDISLDVGGGYHMPIESALPAGGKERESQPAEKETWLIVSSSHTGSSLQTKDAHDPRGSASIITSGDDTTIGIYPGAHSSQQFDQPAPMAEENTSLREVSRASGVSSDGGQTATTVFSDLPKHRSHSVATSSLGCTTVTSYSCRVKKRSCLICGMNFRTGHTFRKHLLKHGRGMLSCITCRRELSNYATYLHHRCAPPDCSRKRKIQSLDAPAARNSDGRSHNIAKGPVSSCSRGVRQYWCEKCEKPFRRRQQLSQHIELHTKYDCRLCTGSYFVCKQHIYHHNRLCHRSKGPSYATAKRYECSLCNKRFMRPGILKIHQRIHTGERPLTCISCHLGFRTPKALARHKLTQVHQKRSGNVPQTKDFVCEVCGSTFSTKMALQRHVASHLDQRVLQCPHCDYQAKEKGTLKIHIRFHFPSEKIFVCESCGAAFHTKSTLQTHMRYKHKDDRDFSCSICQLKLKTRSALNRHLLTHTDNKPHKCTACGSAFRRQYNLRRHAKQVHGSDSELPPVKKLRRIERSADEVLQELMQAEAQTSHSDDGIRVAAAAEFFQDGLGGIGSSHVAAAADTYLTFISDPLTFSQQTYEGLSTVDSASQCPAFSVPHQSISASMETSTIMPSSSTLVHLTDPPLPLQQAAELYQLSGYVPVAAASLPTATTGAASGSLSSFFMATASVHNPMSALEAIPYAHNDDSGAE